MVFCSLVSVLWGTVCGGATSLPREPFAGPLCPGNQIWGIAVIQWKLTSCPCTQGLSASPCHWPASYHIYTVTWLRAEGSICLLFKINSICLYLFCRQSIYKAQMRLSHCLFKAKVLSLHKRMYWSACLHDSEGEKAVYDLYLFLSLCITAPFYS